MGKEPEDARPELLVWPGTNLQHMELWGQETSPTPSAKQKPLLSLKGIPAGFVAETTRSMEMVSHHQQPGQGSSRQLAPGWARKPSDSNETWLKSLSNCALGSNREPALTKAMMMPRKEQASWLHISIGCGRIVAVCTRYSQMHKVRP